MSDHCAVGIVRNAKLPKIKPRIITRRCMSQFSEQGFGHDLALFDWEKISLIPDIECAWKYFHEGLTTIINRHAPFKKYCIKGRDNP